jgi:voltage-gated sodium channel
MSMPFIPVGSAIAALRLVRLMRLVKLLNKIPKLRMLLQGLIAGMGQIGYISALMLLVFYLFGVLGIIMFRDNDPWHWLNVIVALETLFRMATLEDWSDVFYINFYGCDVYDSGLYVTDETLLENGEWGLELGMQLCDMPGAMPVLSALFFFSFIIISSLVLLSMFIGAITISMSECVELMNEEAK